MHDPASGAEALARRLIEHEANGRHAAGDAVPAGERVLERLHEDLARVLGGDGFSALERRAVELARGHSSFLAAGSSGPRSLDDVRAALAGRDPLEVHDALQAVCGHLIGLLFTFLGEPLTTHLVLLAWPDLPGDDPEAHEMETR